MAFAANTHWDVRSGGSNSNGGGFNISSTGTDYSQQTSPQVSYTDLVIGSTNTQLTSAGNPFTSAHVGNVINIVSGTGFTVQRVQVVSVSSAVATCDKACGTAGSTAGVGYLGGSLATPVEALTLATVIGNAVWLQGGTAYALTAALNPTIALTIEGYTTTHGDGGTATLNWAGTSNPAAIVYTTANATNIFLRNLVFTSNLTGTTGIATSSNTGGYTLENCTFTSLGTAVEPTSFYLLSAYNCSFTGGQYGIYTGSGATALFPVVVDNCYFEGQSNQAIYLGGAGNLIARNTVFNATTNGVNGVNQTRTLMLVENCSFYGITQYAVQFSVDWNPSTGAVAGHSAVLRNNIFYDCGTAVSATATMIQQALLSNNALGANTTNYSNVTSTNDVTLSTSPFVSTSNFALNSTSGGGAACKGAGWPGTGFPGGAGASYPDIGAMQSSASTPTTQASNYGYID